MDRNKLKLFSLNLAGNLEVHIITCPDLYALTNYIFKYSGQTEYSTVFRAQLQYLNYPLDDLIKNGNNITVY